MGSNLFFPIITWSFPSGAVVKKSACNAGDAGLIPGLGRSPGREHGESLGQRSLEGYSPWGHKELEMTEAAEHTPM